MLLESNANINLSFFFYGHVVFLLPAVFSPPASSVREILAMNAPSLSDDAAPRRTMARFS